MKTLKHFGLMVQEVSPSEITEIIDKTQIIFVSTNRVWSGTPYIRKKTKIKRTT
jgi:hypothetical protein